MIVDGTWAVTVNSPIGEQKSNVTLVSNGPVLTGTSEGPGGSDAVQDGKVEGNSVSWKTDIKVPMPMTLEFSGTIDGDAIMGNVKAGAFGSFPFTGIRA